MQEDILKGLFFLLCYWNNLKSVFMLFVFLTFHIVNNLLFYLKLQHFSDFGLKRHFKNYTEILPVI